MKVVLAFDSFKGCMTAAQACAAAAEGVRRAGANPVLCPLSDGGEGFVDALTGADGRRVPCRPRGPLDEPVDAEIGFMEDGRTAIVEAAQACGLTLLRAEDRDPTRTTTAGVGEMILLAAAEGAARIVVGLGGTATNDAGMGMLSAMGWRFLDSHGHDLPACGASMAAVARIEEGRRPAAKIVGACDVVSPLHGPLGAAHVFAPQKGATPEQVSDLDAGLANLARFRSHEAGVPGAGAAGGLGFAIAGFLGGTLSSGAHLALELTGFRDKLTGASVCFTGEGRTDGQTAFGKLPAVVAKACSDARVPCVCVSGALGDGWEALLGEGCAEVVSLSSGLDDRTRSIAEAPERLAAATERLARVYLAGGKQR